MKSDTISSEPAATLELPNEVPRRISLNRLETSEEAKDALSEAGQSNVALILRHISGDWGEIISSKRAKMHASDYEGEFISCYRLQNGTMIWITTTPDQSLTIVDVKPKDIKHLLLITFPCERLFVLQHRHRHPNGYLSNDLVGVAPSLAVAVQRQPEQIASGDYFIIAECDDEGNIIREPAEIGLWMDSLPQLMP